MPRCAASQGSTSAPGRMCNVVALCLAFPMTVTGKVQKYLNLPL
jgi:hypothetical protein